MGFHPQLGQTPRFELAARACKELKVPRLRLTIAQAGRLYNILGVTSVAVGTISGTESKCSLTYQLYAVPSNKPLGAAIKLIGSEPEVVSQLPSAARTVLKYIGISESHLPESVGISAAETAEIGHYDWYNNTTPILPDQKQIDELSKKSPVASLISFLHNGRTRNVRSETVLTHLMQQAPDNFLTCGVIITSSQWVPEPLAKLMSDLVKKFAAPDNAVLAYWAITSSQTPGERIAAEERLVRLAPNSSSAWKESCLSVCQPGRVPAKRSNRRRAI